MSEQREVASVSVNVSITPADFKHYCRFITRGVCAPAVRLQRLVVALFSLGVFVLVSAGKPSGWAGLVVFVVVMAACIAVGRRLAPIRFALVRPTFDALFELSDHWVVKSSGGWCTQVPWSGFAEVVVEPEHVYMRIAGTAGFVIPLRCCESYADRQLVLDIVQRRPAATNA